MVYAATAYGFGMHVVDIVRTGGDVVEALKVRNQLPTTNIDVADYDAVVLLLHCDILYSDEWNEQIRIPCSLPSSLPYSRIQTTVSSHDGRERGMDGIIPLRGNFPMQSCSTSL